MEYRTLGRTNLKVSTIAIGTWQLSGPLNLDGKADGFPDVGQDETIALIHACQDFGINLIDSAEIYGAGEGERRIGKALGGRRDRWFLSTKFGFRRGSKGERITDCRPGTIRSSLEDSLKRLQTDYIDIYLYHTPPAASSIDAGKEVLDGLKQEGKIRFYGISTNAADEVEQLVSKNAADVVMFSQSLLTHPQEMLHLVQAHSLGAITRGTFESGLLSGRYFHQRPQLAVEDIRQAWFNNLKTEQYAAYEKFIPPGFSMASLALRYVLDFATTHTIVLGGKTIADYQDALKAFELPPLDAKMQAALKQVKQSIQQPSLQRKVLNKLKSVFNQQLST